MQHILLYGGDKGGNGGAAISGDSTHRVEPVVQIRHGWTGVILGGRGGGGGKGVCMDNACMAGDHWFDEAAQQFFLQNGRLL